MNPPTLRVVLEIRHPGGALQRVHAPAYHAIDPGNLLRVVETSKNEALRELPKWLPSSALTPPPAAPGSAPPNKPAAN